MKKIVLCLILLLFIVKSFCQTPVTSKDYYLEKSKTKKTAGWFMLVGGAIITTIGIASFGSNTVDVPDDADLEINLLPAFLTVVGIGTTIGSIPFFIKSKKYARRAALSFNNQKCCFHSKTILLSKCNRPLL